MVKETRVIGIRHQVKRTADGEARPTLLAVCVGGKVKTMELPDDTAELDWLLGRFPVKFRAVTAEEDFSKFLQRHLKVRKLEDDENVEDIPVARLRALDKNDKLVAWERPTDAEGKFVEIAAKVRKQIQVVTKVPEEYDGLAAGDVVAMVLGGSGDRFAFALSHRAEELGGETRVMRIPPFGLKAERERRGTDKKDDDAIVLATLAEERPNLFRVVTPRDRVLIRLTEAYRLRVDTMKDRIACDQRLRQRLIGNVFLNQEGRYPEGSIEDAYDALKANDVIFKAVEKEERKRIAELEKIVSEFDVYQKVLSPVEGFGPMIGARIIVAVGDIRRFEKASHADEIARLHAEIREHMIAGDYLKDLAHVADRSKGPADTYRNLQLVRSWQRANDKPLEAAFLDEAIAMKERIAELRKKDDSPARLKAYLGVHVLNGGKYEGTPVNRQFPRNRTGNPGNWQRDGRQALFLLCD